MIIEEIFKRIKKKYCEWKNSFEFRKKYCTAERFPFYRIAEKYLPTNSNDIILDLGSGDGGFAEALNLKDRFNKLYLLDRNLETVNKLKNKYKNVILYRAPDKLPFADSEISYIHMSHIVEHLNIEDFYSMLRELDRVLSSNGILIISSPLLGQCFYDDLSHIKPYNPIVFKHYLCGVSRENRSAKIISDKFSVSELVHRYTHIDFDEGWGSRNILIDFILYFAKALLFLLGIKKYRKSGYTLVLKKVVINKIVRELVLVVLLFYI